MNENDKNNEKKVDYKYYKVFYYVGITLMIVGVAIAHSTRNVGFLGLMMIGLIFVVVSIMNKDKSDL